MHPVILFSLINTSIERCNVNLLEWLCGHVPWRTQL